MRTHYDNLQVARNASPEVIKGAYKYLSQKWHPDKHPSDQAKAERISTIINEAYAVLSDPAARKAHDEWIALQERESDSDERPFEGHRSSTDRDHDAQRHHGRANTESERAEQKASNHSYGAHSGNNNRSQSSQKKPGHQSTPTQPTTRVNFWGRLQILTSRIFWVTGILILFGCVIGITNYTASDQYAAMRIQSLVTFAMGAVFLTGGFAWLEELYRGGRPANARTFARWFAQWLLAGSASCCAATTIVALIPVYKRGQALSEALTSDIFILGILGVVAGAVPFLLISALEFLIDGGRSERKFRICSPPVAPKHEGDGEYNLWALVLAGAAGLIFAWSCFLSEDLAGMKNTSRSISTTGEYRAPQPPKHVEKNRGLLRCPAGQTSWAGKCVTPKAKTNATKNGGLLRCPAGQTSWLGECVTPTPKAEAVAREQRGQRVEVGAPKICPDGYRHSGEFCITTRGVYTGFRIENVAFLKANGYTATGKCVFKGAMTDQDYINCGRHPLKHR